MSVTVEGGVHKPYNNFWLSWRFLLGVLVFLGTTNLYTVRVDISVASVCMINHTAVLETEPVSHENKSESTESACVSRFGSSNHTGPDRGEFVWTKQQKENLLSSFFWGYIVTQIPGGILAHRFGGKNVFGMCMLVAGVATLLCPVVARLHYGGIFFLRIIIGLAGGVAFPATHELWSRWAPPLERSVLVGLSYGGTQVGSILAMGLSGILCDALGWASIFYFFGGLCVSWCIVYFVFATETPASHRCISTSEKEFITRSLAGHDVNEKDEDPRHLPWRSILTSMPVWAIVFAHTSWTFGSYLMLTNLPSFMQEVLHFDIKSNGLFSAIPYIAFYICINFSSFLADFLRRRQYLSTKNVRKLLVVIAHVGQAAFFIGTAYCSCGQELLAVAFVAIAQGFSGFVFSGFIVNHIDIAPAYAGILFGVANTFATISGIVAPLVVAVLTPNHTREEWRLVFWVASGILLAGALVYAIFAQGELQPWAVSGKEKTDDGNNGKLPLEPRNTEENEKVPSSKDNSNY